MYNPENPDYSRMKVARYPPVEAGQAGLGVGVHKDRGGLTLLAQDGTGGLEVQLWDVRWVGVGSKP
jgi:isopenicillin N synthase-like dioxygenase